LDRNLAQSFNVWRFGLLDYICNQNSFSCSFAAQEGLAMESNEHHDCRNYI
jgi:hypothetical protein